MEDRLRKFVALVDAGNFTAAAQRLHMSQPALSVAVAKLERELKSTLIVRGVRPVTLTPAGHIAYAAGQDIVIQNANLKTRLTELNNQELHVSIGMIDSVANAMLTSSKGVDNLERQAVVTLAVDNSRNLLRAVSAGQLDVAFVVMQQSYDALLQPLEAAQEPLVLVGSAALSHRTTTELLRRFISYDQASTTHRMIMHALESAGFAPEVAFYSTSPELMLQLVLQGRGVAVLPYLLVRDYIAAGELTIIGQPPFLVARPIQLVKRKGAVLASPLTHLGAEVTSVLHNLENEARHKLG